MHNIIFRQPKSQNKGVLNSSKLERNLAGHQLLALLQGALLVSETVLDFGLQMAGETVAEDGIDAPNVTIPGSFAAGAVVDIGEKLLVPTNGSE